MKLPPGQQIFTTAYVHDGYKYVLLFLAPDLEHAREQCWRLGIDDKHELGSLECEVEMTPDGTLTRWDKDAETETDARITQLERELAEAITERDAAILKEAIGEGSHRRICDDLIALRGSIAPLHAESADRLRIIEEVAAVIGFKYPSECRDFLAQRVREKIEEAQTAGRVLAKAVANTKDTRDWPELTNTRQAGLFCGVEDHDLLDRYEGARYGYQDALERCDEFIRNAVSDVDTNPTALAWIKQAQEEASNGN